MGEFGGAGAPYNTGFNTMGIGDPVPAGNPAMTGADFADKTTNGSGDLWNGFIKTGKGKKKKDIIYTNPKSYGNGLDYIVYCK